MSDAALFGAIPVITVSRMSVWCSAIIRPIARVVFKQECLEGNFRFAHMRLRTFLTELALYRAGAAEEAALDTALMPVLSNQLRLLMWRWLLTACTTGLEYTGALLNYSCIALIVFTGMLYLHPSLPHLKNLLVMGSPHGFAVRAGGLPVSTQCSSSARDKGSL